MGQARILLPEDHKESGFFKQRGFRFCKKDKRWEKNTNKPKEVIESLYKDLIFQNNDLNVDSYPTSIKE